MTIYMKQAARTAQLPMSEAEREARVELAASLLEAQVRYLALSGNLEQRLDAAPR